MAAIVVPADLSAEGRGCGLVTRAAVRAGTLLLRDDPLALVVMASHRTSICAWCVNSGETASLLRCTGCQSSYYCGRACQRAAWSTHRQECTALAQLSPAQRVILPTVIRLAALCVWRGYGTRDGGTVVLQSNRAALSVDDKEMLAQLLVGLSQFMAPLPLPQSSLDIMVMVQCNTFGVCDGELRAVGAALYPVAGLCNHSCAPNAVAIHAGRTVELRALRALVAGEEVCVSYIDLLRPAALRRAELASRYFFDCSCTRCATAPDDVFLTAERASDGGVSSDQRRDLVQQLVAQSSSNVQSVQDLGDALQAATVSDTHHAALAALNRLTDLAIMGEDWLGAQTWAERALAAMQTVIGPATVDAVVGLQRLRVAKLQHHLGALAAAVRSYQQAADILRVTHGSAHPLVQGLQGALHEAESELRHTMPRKLALRVL